MSLFVFSQLVGCQPTEAPFAFQTVEQQQRTAVVSDSAEQPVAGAVVAVNAVDLDGTTVTLARGTTRNDGSTLIRLTIPAGFTTPTAVVLHPAYDVVELDTVTVQAWLDAGTTDLVVSM